MLTLLMTLTNYSLLPPSFSRVYYSIHWKSEWKGKFLALDFPSEEYCTTVNIAWNAVHASSTLSFHRSP